MKRRQINILNELFKGSRGSGIVTPEAWHHIQFSADVAVNQLELIDPASVTVADGRKLAKSLIDLLETIPAVD